MYYATIRGSRRALPAIQGTPDIIALKAAEVWYKSISPQDQDEIKQIYVFIDQEGAPLGKFHIKVEMKPTFAMAQQWTPSNSTSKNCPDCGIPSDYCSCPNSNQG
jgi:hypothetical protein